MKSFLRIIIPIWVSFTALFLLSSCFEITEEASFNKNGSGNYTLTFDLSKIMKEMGLTDLKQIKENTAQIDSLKKELSSVKGISDVRQSIDDKNGIVQIGFKFANIDALNEVMRMKNKAKSNAENYFTMMGKNFQRSKALPGLASGADLEEEIAELKRDTGDNASRAILGSIAYKSIYKFDRKIAQCSNKRAVVAKNGKSIFLAFTVQDMLDGKSDSLFENTVTFK